MSSGQQFRYAGVAGIPVRKVYHATAATTDVVVWDPGTGQQTVMTDMSLWADLAVTVTIYDETNQVANILFNGSIGANGGDEQHNITPAYGLASGSKLKITTSGPGAYLVLKGWEQPYNAGRT